MDTCLALDQNTEEEEKIRQLDEARTQSHREIQSNTKFNRAHVPLKSSDIDHQSDEYLAHDLQDQSNKRQKRHEALAVLISRYESELYQFLYRFTNDRAISEDLFQETFIQVYSSIQTYDCTKRFRPWLFTIAANKARDHLRKRRMIRISDINTKEDTDASAHQFFEVVSRHHHDTPYERLAQEELNQTVREKVQELPEALRETLILNYFHQFAYAQIAEMLSIPIGTVKSRIHSAIGKLSQTLKTKTEP